jgi:protease-4
VDELGDLDHAIKVAAELAGLTNYQVKTITSSSDPLMEFLKKQMGDAKSSVVREAMGDDYELMNKIRSIRQTTGIQARLPFDMEVL